MPETTEAPTRFTKPSHMFFSEDSIYNGQNDFIGGKWEGNTFIQGHDKFYDSEQIQEYLDYNYTVVHMEHYHQPKTAKSPC